MPKWFYQCWINCIGDEFNEGGFSCNFFKPQCAVAEQICKRWFYASNYDTHSKGYAC